MDEPDLPDGTEVDLAVVDDELDDDDRARLPAALDAADDELRAGMWVDGPAFIAALRRGEM